MAAALVGLAGIPPQIMVLSDMLELGDGTGRAHDALVPLLTPLLPREVIALGPEMGRMTTALAAVCPSVTCYNVDDSEQAISLLASLVKKNDRIFIKGSNGSGAHQVASAIIAALTPTPKNAPDSAIRSSPQEGESHAA